MDYSKFYTPPSIAKALINVLNLPTPPKVVDICCGSCNLLLAVKKRWPQIKMYGVDIITTTEKKVIFEKKDGRQFAIDHSHEFSLVVANPPFDFVKKKKQFPELFVNEFKDLSTSRLEIEMLIANLKLLKHKGVLLIILPSSFVEGRIHNNARKIISTNYFIESIIKLDESTFGSSRINSYALIIYNELQDSRNAKIGVSNIHDGNNISYYSVISSDELKNGCWTKEKNNGALISVDIKRGNISSNQFIKKGHPVLHTAKNNCEWKPGIRYISKEVIPSAFAETGDIVVSRIGKSAGQWCVYTGKKIPISDCLYRIKDPDGLIIRRIRGHTYNLSLKGVATRYITINDFLYWLSLIMNNSDL